MPYTTGSQTDANPALAFMNTLDPLIVAAGFDFIEEVAISTDKTRVYKSPAASNTANVDWYLYMRRVSDADGAVKFCISEAWDAAAKKIQKYVPSGAFGIPNVAAGYTVQDTVGVLTNSATTSWQSITITATAFNYWLSLNSNRCIVAVRPVAAPVNYACYLGLTDEVMPISVPGAGVGLYNSQMVIAIAVAPANPSATMGGYTREPGKIGGTTGNGSAYIAGAWGFSGIPTAGLAANQDSLYALKPYASRVVVCSNLPGTVGGNSPRGILKDVLMAFVATPVNGDTLTVDGVAWVLMQNAATTMALFVDPRV